jgi:glycosyltransferase involved in cell wall biosynthesis
MWKSLTGLNVYYYLWQLCVVPTVRRLHREYQFDVAHHVTYARYWMPSAASRLGIPYVIGPVGGGEGAPDEFYRTLGFYGWLVEQARRVARWALEFDPQVASMLSNAGVCFASSNESARRMRKLGASNVVVKSSIGPVAASGDAVGAAVDGPFRLICVGRLLHWKGFHLAVRAFAQARLDNAELIICGDGPARRWLEQHARNLGVADRVRFTGEVPREQVVSMLRSSDVLVHPSLHESGGFVVIEAMEQARPVICLDLGGPAVHVSDQTGIRIAANQVEDTVSQLTDAMRQLHTDRSLCRRLGEQARQRVRDEFGWEAKARVFDRCYRQLIADNRIVATVIA